MATFNKASFHFDCSNPPLDNTNNPLLCLKFFIVGNFLQGISHYLWVFQKISSYQIGTCAQQAVLKVPQIPIVILLRSTKRTTWSNINNIKIAICALSSNDYFGEPTKNKSIQLVMIKKQKIPVNSNNIYMCAPLITPYASYSRRWT